ncbi:MAG: tetratricopeptide repeat protein [Acidobacteriota bacterium]
MTSTIRHARLPKTAIAPRTRALQGLLIALSLFAAAPAVLASEAERSLEEGGKALLDGRLEAAEAAFGEASRVEPENPEAWLGLAEVAERRRSWLEGLGFARRVLDLEPRSPEGLEAVARFQIRLGAPREALDSLEALRRAAPQKPFGYLAAALVLRDVDRLDQATEVLESAVEAGVTTPDLLAQLGFLLLAQQKADRAEAVARGGLERFPDAADLELVVGLALAAGSGDRDEAARFLRLALDHGASDPGRVHWALGDVLAEAGGCRPEATEHFEKARDLRPEDPQAHYRVAIARRACQDAEGAREAIETFRRLSRDADSQDHRRKSVGAALNEVQRLANAGQLPEARGRLDALASEHPSDDRILTLRAKILFSMGSREEALGSAERARALMPGRVETHYLEGLILSQLGRLGEAEKALERARALDGERAEVLQLLGAVVAELGRPKAAAEIFRRAVEIDGDDAVLRLAYAKLLASLGRSEESAAQMERFRQLQGHDSAGR